MKLRCLRNGILFVLLQKINEKGMFMEETTWGFEIMPGQNIKEKQHDGFHRTIDIGRWGKVLTVGPECEEVVVGDYVCVEPQMWTNAFKYDGIQIRKTDESKIMLISKEKPEPVSRSGLKLAPRAGLEPATL